MSKTEVKQQKLRPIQRCPKSALYIEHESTAPGGRGLWAAKVPAEHTIEDVLSPHYFGGLQIARGGLREGDYIDIEPESALWRVNVRVMAVVPALQQVRTREVRNMRETYETKAPEGYEFVWSGGAAKWAIKRGDTTLDAGFASQEEALARLEEILSTQAA